MPGVGVIVGVGVGVGPGVVVIVGAGVGVAVGAALPPIHRLDHASLEARLHERLVGVAALLDLLAAVPAGAQLRRDKTDLTELRRRIPALVELSRNTGSNYIFLLYTSDADDDTP